MKKTYILPQAEVIKLNTAALMSISGQTNDGKSVNFYQSDDSSEGVNNNTTDWKEL